MFNKILRQHLWKKISMKKNFQKLNAEKWTKFYWNEIEVPHVAHKD